MLHIHYQMLTQWLHSHPHWGGIAAFIVAFAESIAVIGTIVPGTVTMTAVGILMGSAVIPTLSTLLLAISGAVCGDVLSYHLGSIYKNAIPNIWPFRKHPHWLSNAKQFFFKHGGKSILIGRFVGPIRAFIPIIAGILDLSKWRFYPIDIISASCWAIVYLLPGYIIGIAAANLPPHIAAKLIMMLLLILAGFWLLVWVMKWLWQFLGRKLDRLSQYCWRQWIIKGRRTAWLYFLLRDARRPRDHGQLILLGWSLVSLITFIIIAILTINDWWVLTHVDLWFHHFLRGFRTSSLDTLFAIISSGTNLGLLAALTLLTVAMMAYDKHFMALGYWLLALITTTLLVWFLKLSHHLAYPADIAQPNTGLSAFPSLNIALSGVVYGFIAWFVCFDRLRWKRYVYPLILCWLVLLIIAQIYLSFNWLSATLAGFLLATGITTLAAMSYQRHQRQHPANWRFVIVVVPLGLLLLMLTVFTTWSNNLQNSLPVWPKHQLKLNQWWHQQASFIPHYRRNRLDYPDEILNIQWAGEIDTIHQHLHHHGWQDWYIGLSQDSLKQLAHDKTLRHIHLFDELYQDQHPALRMTKTIKGNQFVLRLWPSHIQLLPSKMPLWVGTLKQRSHQSQNLTLNKAKQVLQNRQNQYNLRLHQLEVSHLPKLLTYNNEPYTILLKPQS